MSNFPLLLDKMDNRVIHDIVAIIVLIEVIIVTVYYLGSHHHHHQWVATEITAWTTNGVSSYFRLDSVRPKPPSLFRQLVLHCTALCKNTLFFAKLHWSLFFTLCTRCSLQWGSVKAHYAINCGRQWRLGGKTGGGEEAGAVKEVALNIMNIMVDSGFWFQTIMHMSGVLDWTLWTLSLIQIFCFGVEC